MHTWTHGVARASGCHRAYVAERQIHSRQMWKFPVSGESANRIEGGKKREFGSLARREIIHSDLRDAALHQRRNAVDAARHREDRYELSHVSPRNRIRASSRLRSDSQIRPIRGTSTSASSGFGARRHTRDGSRWPGPLRESKYAFLGKSMPAEAPTWRAPGPSGLETCVPN